MDDTGIRETIKYFCVLKIWFDDMAYNLLKNYSFVRAADNDDEISKNSFYIDNAVQEILLSKYKKENPYVIATSLKNANSYFAAQIDSSDDDYIFCGYCYRLWSETIIRLVDDADSLKNFYEEFFEPRTGLKIGETVDSNFRADSENITQAFFAKIKDATEENCVPYAYFQLMLGYLNNVR